jgi:hypothetical protein
MSARTTSAIGSSQAGDIDWVDLENNWRAQDSEWLQERSIVRVATDVPNIGTDFLFNLNAGRVFYSVAGAKLLLSVGGGVIKKVMASDALVATDAPTTVFFGIDGQPGITFTKATGAAVIAALTVTTLTAPTLNTTTFTAAAGTGSLATNVSGVDINTTASGANKVTLTTGSGKLLINKPVDVTGAITSTAGLSGTTGTFSGALAAVSAAISGTLSVGGASTLAAVTATTVDASGTIKTPNLQAPAATDIYVTTVAGKTLRFVSSSVAESNYYYGSAAVTAATPRLAFVVYGSDPGVGNVPEGTLWVS